MLPLLMNADKQARCFAGCSHESNKDSRELKQGKGEEKKKQNVATI